MAARKLWKGEKAIPKNREPFKKKELPPRPPFKKKVLPPSPPWKGEPPIRKRVEPRIGIPPQVNPIKFKSAPARSPTLKRNIKKR